MTARKPHALVVDDQPLICSILRRELRSRYVVEVSTSGADALGRIRTGTAYALILCDLIMPDVTGLDVVDAIERQRPELLRRLICMTGGVCAAEDLARLATIGAPLLIKPFGSTELLQAIIEVERR